MASRSLLVVEDDRVIRYAMRTIFTLRGWIVSTASTLSEALEMLEPPPDCVLLDLMLPDGPGETVLRAVRDRGLPTRVVVATAVTDADRIIAVESLEPDELLLKPVSVRDVCRACLD